MQCTVHSHTMPYPLLLFLSVQCDIYWTCDKFGLMTGPIEQSWIYIYMHMHISCHKVQSLPTNMCRHMYTYITTDHMYINMILYIYTYSDTHLKKP